VTACSGPGGFRHSSCEQHLEFLSPRSAAGDGWLLAEREITYGEPSSALRPVRIWTHDQFGTDHTLVLLNTWFSAGAVDD